MSSEAQIVARSLKAKRTGTGWIASCPCPGHGKGRGDKNPSLTIRDGDDGRLLLNCQAGCQFNDVLCELQDRGIISTDGSKLSRARAALAFAHKAPERAEPDPTRALHLWESSIPLLGTPVQNYLERRGITEVPPSLRCCYQHDDDVGMIAAVHRSDGEVIGAQVKLVTRAGVKVPGIRPDTIGNLGDGAVRLAHAAEVMGIAEGVETALSAQALAKIPVWAALGSKRLHRIALPDIVRELHIFCDNDQPGREAAQRAADVHVHAGRVVKVRTPPEGLNDYNDFLLVLADRGAAA